MNELDSQKQEVTQLLVAWREDDNNALEKLMPLVENELRRIAHNYMRKEKGDHTLQTTALVNEAYIKLVDQNVVWQNRAHFFGIAAKIMRRILLNHARDNMAGKRGGRFEHIALDEGILTKERSSELVALDEALKELSKFDQLKSQIVELRYFGGLTIEETAEVLGIAPITVSTNWRLAKAWLARQIRG